MNKLKIIVFFLLSVCMIPFQQVAHASERTNETFTVTIHKRLFDESSNSLIQNTGQEMEVGGEPLSGAEFQVYDATNEYYLLLDKNGSNMVKAIQKLQTEYITTGEKSSLKKVKTNDEGVAVFSDLMEFKGDRQAVYVFVETATPVGIKITEKAAPIVLVTPIYALDNKGMTTDTKLFNVHVYPKNIGYKPIEPIKPEKPEKPTPVKPEKPTLPMTGQTKSALSILGILIVLTVVWIWKKRTTK